MVVHLPRFYEEAYENSKMCRLDNQPLFGKWASAPLCLGEEQNWTRQRGRKSSIVLVKWCLSCCHGDGCHGYPPVFLLTHPVLMTMSLRSWWVQKLTIIQSLSSKIKFNGSQELLTAYMNTLLYWENHKTSQKYYKVIRKHTILIVLVTIPKIFYAPCVVNDVQVHQEEC